MKKKQCSFVITAIPLDHETLLDIAKRSFLYARIDIEFNQDNIGSLHGELNWPDGYGLLGLEYSPLPLVTPEIFAIEVLTVNCPLSIFGRNKFDTSVYRVPFSYKDTELFLKEVEIIGVAEDSKISSILKEGGFDRIDYNEVGCRGYRTSDIIQ